MTCAEFQRILIVGELTDLERHEHPGSCTACRDLVGDLRAIAVAARFLRAADPGEHVWHRISQTLGLASGQATHPDIRTCVLEAAQR